jgi:hypothetical protein
MALVDKRVSFCDFGRDAEQRRAFCKGWVAHPKPRPRFVRHTFQEVRATVRARESKESNGSAELCSLTGRATLLFIASGQLHFQDRSQSLATTSR